MDYKAKLLHDFFLKYKGQKIKILDIGSGKSENFINILKENPSFHYTGIEYRESSIEKARKNLNGLNFSILKGFGENQSIQQQNFDVVLSLSVLEHVKYLDEFLNETTSFLKKGGELLHRYDLGHAIYPSTFRERIKVFLCNNFPFLISKKHFTCYPDLNNICEILKQNNIINIEITQYQMPSLKKAMNILGKNKSLDDLTTDLQKLEVKIYENLKLSLSQKEIDILFPSILIKGIKN